MRKSRKENIQSHINAGDYFGTLATVLDLLRQDAEKTDFKKKRSVLLKNLTEDLVYLQNNYRITGVEKDSVLPPRGQEG